MEDKYIKARCRTYLDGYECDINRFVAVPRIGDSVGVTIAGQEQTLKVCSITHRQTDAGDPYIDVELNH